MYFLASPGFLQFTPTVDGNVIPQEPLQAVEQGNFTDVPVLLGTNRNEGATFIYAALDNSLPSFLAPIAYDVLFGFNNSKEIASKPRYSPDSSDDARVIFSHMATDYLFRCSSEVFPTALIKKNVNSYMYRFSHIFSHSSIYHKFGLPDICVTEVSEFFAGHKMIWTLVCIFSMLCSAHRYAMPVSFLLSSTMMCRR